MPIAPEHRWLYPIDWSQISERIRFQRAKRRYEHCRRPHGREVLHLGDGTWWDEEAATWRDGRGRGLRYLPPPAGLLVDQPALAGMKPPVRLLTTRVVLASAHLNRNPGDNQLRNLAALCQRRHMLHDTDEHHRCRRLNASRLRAVRDFSATKRARAPATRGTRPLYRQE